MPTTVSEEFLRYFKPSWLSNLIGFTVSAALVGGMAVYVWYTKSELSQQVYYAHQRAPITAPAGYESFVNTLSSNRITASLPLLLFWGGVGWVVYLITVSIWDHGRRAVEFDKELHYRNAHPRAQLRMLAERFCIRVFAAIIGIAMVIVVINVILPYVLMLATAISVTTPLVAVEYAVLGIVASWLTCHVLLVALRFAFLRPRFIGTE